jgi:putative transposase
LYQSIGCLLARRSRFIARDLFHRKRADPQNCDSFVSISTLVFNLTLYAFRIFGIYIKYTKNNAIMQDLRTKRHVVFSLHLHLVFVTKYRKKVFTQKMYERLKYHFERVCGDFGCKLIEIGGQRDHVHLLIEPLPHTTPSRLVNSLKGVSSRFLRKEFPELEKYYWKGGLWSPSYFIASCGGAPLDIVKEYIEKQ